jgi:hypothetical protein
MLFAMTVRARALGLALALAACAPSAAPAPAPAPTTSPSASAAPRDAERELEERIRGVVVTLRPRLRACYEDALAKTPTLAGRVVLVLEVAQDGAAAHVFEAKREGTLGDDEVKCLVRVLKSARFHDGAAAAMRIQIPLAFTAAE